MPFARPTLSDLRAQIKADLGSDWLRFANVPVLGKALAGALWGQYGYLDWIARQSTPFTAKDEALEGWAALKGVTRKAATKASGPASFAASGSSPLPAGTPVVLTSTGAAYVVTTGGVASGGSVAVTIQAVQAGATGNVDSGAGLTLGSAVAGVSPNGATTAALSGGADVELDASLRTRMLAAYAAPAKGGAQSDYVEWALGAPGVTRAWVSPRGQGPGTVVVYVMLDDAEATHNGFPQGSNGVAALETRDVAATGDQLVVANAIYPLQPVTALVYVVAPRPNTVAFTLAGLSAATADIKAAIAAAIDAALLAVAAPGGSVNLSAIESAIAAVPLTAGFVITAITCDHGTVSPGSAGNISSAAGYLPVRGAVTYS